MNTYRNKINEMSDFYSKPIQQFFSHKKKSKKDNAQMGYFLTFFKTGIQYSKNSLDSKKYKTMNAQTRNKTSATQKKTRRSFIKKKENKPIKKETKVLASQCTMRQD